MLQIHFVPAGGRLVNAKASFFRYEAANAMGGDESLRVRADGQDLGTYLPGDAIELPTAASTWELTPAGTATATVRLGVAGVSSSRIFGNVRIIDSGSDKTIAGKQYLNASAQPAVVGKASFAGVRAQGSRLAVKRFVASSSVAGLLQVFTTPDTPQAGAGATSAAGMFNKSALVNGGSHERIYAQPVNATVAAADFGGNTVNVFLGYCPANGTIELPLTTPIVLPALAILGVHSLALNRDVAISVDFEDIG